MTQTETVAAPSRKPDLCPTCGQQLPTPCSTCGVGTRLKGGIRSHTSNHQAVPDSEGNCYGCGLPTKERWNNMGHVFDHQAVIEGEA